MALNIFNKYGPDRANAPTTAFPQGSLKNESVPGANDGTPLDQDWGNDYAGADAALLEAVGITPNGLVDTSELSQRLDALRKLSNTFAESVAVMKTIDYPKNSLVTTGGYYGGWVALVEPEGAATYLIADLQDVRDAKGDPSWNVDNFGDHGMDNGFVAVLVQNLKNIDLSQYGCRHLQQCRPNIEAAITACDDGALLNLKGIYLLDDEIETPKNFSMRGTGKINALAQNSGSGIQITSVSAGVSCFNFKGFVGSKNYQGERFFEDMSFVGANISHPCHGVVIANKMSRTTFNRVSFFYCGRSAIAQDPTEDSYFQNLALRDVSFYDGGAAFGYKTLPTPGQAFLGGTSIHMSNINIDNTIGEAQAIKYLWDFRAVREVTVNGIVNEGGVNTNALTAIYGFATDTFCSIDGAHGEFSGALASDVESAVFENNSTGNFANQTECELQLKAWNSPYPFRFEDATESRVSIDNWSFYNAASASDLVTFEGDAGELDVDCLLVKTPFSIPKNIRGRLNVNSLKSRDKNLPLLNWEEKPLFYWKAGATDLETDGRSAFMYVNDQSGIDSKAQEADGNFQVMRYTGSASFPIIQFIVTLPTEYVGSHAILACHYKCDSDASSFNLFNAPVGSSLRLNIDTDVIDNTQYRTAYLMFKVTSTNMVFNTTGSGATATILRIASLSLALGKKIEEPLDITRS